jgi:hypothetical protein
MPMKDAAALDQDCPGIRIHTIDIFQPPGIAIPCIVDMDAHQTIVSAMLTAKSEPAIPKKARSEALSVSMLRQVWYPRLLAREVV